MPTWLEVTVEVPAHLAEPLSSFLFDQGVQGVQIDEGEQFTALKAYFDHADNHSGLVRYCFALAQQEPGVGIIIRQAVIDDQPWSENWKKNFETMRVGERIVVYPPWVEPSDSFSTAIVINPGMAFGTGQHATTRGCLVMIERHASRPAMRKALDIGTGSGILGILMAKLGLFVTGVDPDPVALQQAGDNARANGVDLQLVESLDDVDDGRFDMIAANLYTNLLKNLSADMCARVASDGVIICSGFILDDEEAVRVAFERYGVRVHDRIEDSGWVTLVFAAGNRK